MADNQEEKDLQLTEQELSEVMRVRREKLSQLQSEGNDPFIITKYDVTNHSDEIKNDFNAFENKDVCIAGRMMSKRIMGKTSRIIWTSR